MESYVDRKAKHWVGVDISENCKSVAIRERGSFKPNQHCPYLCLIIMLRIFLMFVFTLTFFVYVCIYYKR
eukprot:UN14360